MNTANLLMPIGKISSTIRQLGWIEGGVYFLSRGLSALTLGHARLVRYHFVAQPIPAECGAGVRPSPKSSIAFVAASDPLVASFPRPSAVIKKRFADGSACLVAKAGEKFAGFLWFVKGQYEEDEVRCLYQLLRPEESVFDFDVYVEPEFRYGRTFARLWGAANAHLAADGVHWSFSRIATSNTESIRSHARLGIQKLFTANFLCLGKLQITIANVDPFVHLSFSPSSRPSLGLLPPAANARHD
jgi:hypothetical protein